LFHNPASLTGKRRHGKADRWLSVVPGPSSVAEGDGSNGAASLPRLPSYCLRPSALSAPQGKSLVATFVEMSLA